MAVAQVLIFLGALTGVATACHWLRLPTIVGFILAGMVVGPQGLALVPNLPNADAIAEVAVVLLMFTIGLEFSWQRLREMRQEFLRLGLSQVLLTTVITTAASHFGLGFPLGKSILFGFLLAPSSTALVLKLLGDSRDLETPYGQGSLAILLFQDLAVIPMMIALPLLAGGERAHLPEPQQLASGLLGLALLFLVLVIAGRYVIPNVLIQVVRTGSRELFFFGVLFLCLAVAYAFELTGLSLSLGAFAAGMMLAEGPYGRQVVADILPLRDNFLGLVFASIGMLLDPLTLIRTPGSLPRLLLLAAVAALIKVAVVWVVAVARRLPNSIAVIMGLILAQVGEFSFILAQRAREIGLIGITEHQEFLTISVLSMVCTPFLFRVAPRLALSQRRRLWRATFATPAGEDLKAKIKAHESHTPVPLSGHAAAAHAIIIGFGITGRNVAAAFDSLTIPYQVLELNVDVVEDQRRRGLAIHFGDATRPEVLEAAGLGHANLVIVAVSGNKLLSPIVTAIRRLRPDVQIIVRAQYVRGIESLPREAHTEVVVAEIETAVELLARALRVYGVGAEDMHRIMDQTRRQLISLAQLLETKLSNKNLTLPHWAALAALRPLPIRDDFKACGQTLGTLDLAKRTGAIAVTVFRPGLGASVPKGDFVIKAGDVLHLIGDEPAMIQAETLLRDG